MKYDDMMVETTSIYAHSSLNTILCELKVYLVHIHDADGF